MPVDVELVLVRVHLESHKAVQQLLRDDVLLCVEDDLLLFIREVATDMFEAR